MHTSQIEVLLKSLCKQLQCTEEALNPKVISLIQESKLYTYGDVKILSLKLKPFLSKNEHPIKYSQVINMLSKALGYENQHSFVALSKTNAKTYLGDSQNSTLKSFLILKDEFLKKFKINSWYIGDSSSSKHEFSFIYSLAKNSEYKKIDINRYLREHGLKPYKNTIPLFKISYAQLHNIAFNIVKYYRSFFHPMWQEHDASMKNYEHIRNDWCMLSYSDIRTFKNYLIVDGYSTDMPHQTIKDFLMYVFRFGEEEDIDVLEKWLNGENYQRESKARSFNDYARLYGYVDYKIQHHFFRTRSQTIEEALQDMPNSIDIQAYMLEYFKKFEKNEHKTIKQIIIEQCTFFQERECTYELVLTKLCIDLLKKTKYELINEASAKNQKEFEEIQDQLNCLKELTNQILMLVKMWKEENIGLEAKTNEY